MGGGPPSRKPRNSPRTPAPCGVASCGVVHQPIGGAVERCCSPCPHLLGPFLARLSFGWSPQYLSFFGTYLAFAAGPYPGSSEVPPPDVVHRASTPNFLRPVTRRGWLIGGPVEQSWTPRPHSKRFLACFSQGGCSEALSFFGGCLVIRGYGAADKWHRKQRAGKRSRPPSRLPQNSPRANWSRG